MAGSEQRDLAAGYLAGEKAAERAIRTIVDGFAQPDRLLTNLRDLLEADGVQMSGTPRLRGWTRRIAKFIEAEGRR